MKPITIISLFFWILVYFIYRKYGSKHKYDCVCYPIRYPGIESAVYIWTKPLTSQDLSQLHDIFASPRSIFTNFEKISNIESVIQFLHDNSMFPCHYRDIMTCRLDYVYATLIVYMMIIIITMVSYDMWILYSGNDLYINRLTIMKYIVGGLYFFTITALLAEEFINIYGFGPKMGVLFSYLLLILVHILGRYLFNRTMGCCWKFIQHEQTNQ